MPTGTKTKWKSDSRGRYSRDLGYKRNGADDLVPHRFYLGTDLVEAQHRNMWLDHCFE